MEPANSMFQHYLHGLGTAFSRGVFATGRFCPYPNNARAKIGVQQKDLMLWDTQVIEYMADTTSNEPNLKCPVGGYANGILVSGNYKTTEDPRVLLAWFRGLLDGYLTMSEEDGVLSFDTTEADSSQRLYVNNVIQKFIKETKVNPGIDQFSNLALKGDDKFNMVWLVYHSSTLLPFAAYPPATVAIARMFNPFSFNLTLTQPWASFEIGDSPRPELTPPSSMGPSIQPAKLRSVNDTKRIWAYETCPVATKDGYYAELVVLNDVLGNSGWMPLRSPNLFDLTEPKVPTLAVVPFAPWASDIPPPVSDIRLTFVFHRKVNLTIGVRESSKRSISDEPTGGNNNNSTMSELD